MGILGKKIFVAILLFSLLFITLLRSQVLSFKNLAFDNNPANAGIEDTNHAKAGRWFPPAIDRPNFYENTNLLKNWAGGAVGHGTVNHPPDFDWLDELLEKIRQAESGGKPNPPDGDGGNAIGPLQIHKAVLDDVNKRFGTNFTHENCRDIGKAKTIARLYISMWTETHREEIAARIFNGGPRGWRKSSTDAYWAKIQRMK